MAKRKAAPLNILVPVDGSAPSRRALREAVAIARPARARITALHVVTPFEALTYREALPAVITLPDFERHAMRAADRILSAVQRAARAAGVACACHTAWQASAADAIVTFARRHGCNLIVMGSHGRRGLQRMLLGSVTHTVLANSRVPVMVCR
jgi:nucleotide-binding universal stress UspA family protein